MLLTACSCTAPSPACPPPIPPAFLRPPPLRPCPPRPASTPQVKAKFPDTSAQLLVACSDGKAYSMDVLGLLDEAGYANIVGLRGGFYAWYRIFDNNLRRRRTGEYAETLSHGGDSCGIHSSGAGFAKVDPQEQWVPPKF